MEDGAGGAPDDLSPQPPPLPSPSHPAFPRRESALPGETPSPPHGASCAPVSAAAPPRAHRNGRHREQSSLPCGAAAAPRAGGWGGGHGRRRRCPPAPPPRDVNRGRFARPLPGQRSPPALTALRARPPPAPRRREAAVEEEVAGRRGGGEGSGGSARAVPPPSSSPPSLRPSLPALPARCTMGCGAAPPNMAVGGSRCRPSGSEAGEVGKARPVPAPASRALPFLSPSLLFSFPEAAQILTGSGEFAGEEAKFNPLSWLCGTGWHSCSRVLTLGCSGCGASLPGAVPVPSLELSLSLCSGVTLLGHYLALGTALADNTKVVGSIAVWAKLNLVTLWVPPKSEYSVFCDPLVPTNLTQFVVM